MTYFANLSILFAATLFVGGVTAKAANFDIFFPNFPDFPPIPKNPPQESTEKPAEYKEIVFGEDVEGAKILTNYYYVYSTEPEPSEISSDFSYPFGDLNSNSQKITKIVLLIEKTNGDISAEGIIKKGGVGENNVSLQVLIKKSNKLHYIATIYGIDSDYN